MARKRISDRTKYAAALLTLYPDMYLHAKLMGETNFLSLFDIDHNIYVESGDPDCNEFWNLTPRFTPEHRAKTRRDARIIAKGRRIRKRLALGEAIHDPTVVAWYGPHPKRKIPSRPFDKTLKRRLRRQVVPR